MLWLFCVAKAMPLGRGVWGSCFSFSDKKFSKNKIIIIVFARALLVRGMFCRFVSELSLENKCWFVRKNKMIRKSKKIFSIFFTSVMCCLAHTTDYNYHLQYTQLEGFQIVVDKLDQHSQKVLD